MDVRGRPLSITTLINAYLLLTFCLLYYYQCVSEHHNATRSLLVICLEFVSLSINAICLQSPTLATLPYLPPLYIIHIISMLGYLCMTGP